jgi:DNA-binding transcriptional ArsR family regulator
MGIIKPLYTLQIHSLAMSMDILSHPGRVKIIQCLLIHESLNLGQIKDQLGLSQSATSDQVKVLREAGVIVGQHLGTSIRYRLNEDTWDALKDVHRSFWEGIALL